MNSFSIAFKMFRSNLQSHALYLGVLILSVAVYYEFMFLKYSPEFLHAQDAIQAAKIAAAMTSFLMLVFLFFFLFYSSSFFMKQRRKEIAVYAFMGISNRRIGRIFAIESLFTGGVALVAGLGFGILFSRLFMMAVAKVALLDVAVGFSVAWPGVRELLVVFGLFFAGVSFWHYLKVVWSTLIDLIRDESHVEGMPRLKWVRAVLSIVFIISGYYLSQQLLMMVPVVVLVVIGTFWLFGALVPAVAGSLSGNKRVFWKGVRIVAVSNILFRIRSNYRSLAMIAVMTATTITAFGTALSLKYYVGATQHVNYPYSFSFLSTDPKLEANARAAVEHSENTLLDWNRIEVLNVPASFRSSIVKDQSSIPVVRLSEFRKVQEAVAKRYPHVSLPIPELTDTDAFYVFSPATVGGLIHFKGTRAEIGGTSFLVTGERQAPLFGRGAMYQTDAMIVSDAAWERLATSGEKQVFHGIAVARAASSDLLTKKLASLMTKKERFFSYSDVYRSNDSFFGLFFFLGSFMSIVFIFATGSILYFKILSEGLADKGKYEVLRKIGMTESELKRSVSMQVGLSLIIPLAVGILHSLFAVAELSNILAYSLVVPLLAAIGIYLLCFAGFYFATTRKFLQIVQGTAANGPGN